MLKVIATAPTRVDLAGGTLDLWPIHNLLPRRATVNVAIDLNATVTISSSQDGRFHLVSTDQNLNDSGSFEDICASKTLGLLGLLLSAVWTPKLPPITLTTKALSPAGAGLGGSSCLSVTVLKALCTARKLLDPSFLELDEEQLVRTAQDVESVIIHAPTGVQDYWGAIRGGINILRFPFGATLVETFQKPLWRDQDFKLICVYSGKSRASALNNWEIFKRIYDGDKALLSQMAKIGEAGDLCAEALHNNRWDQLIEASRCDWNIRRNLWPSIETPETKAIDTAALKAGALFTRVCGAGGGGVMAIFSPIARADDVCSNVTAAGGQVLNVNVGVDGLRIVEKQM